MAYPGNERVLARSVCKCNNLSGELIVTNLGLAFEKATGFLSTGRTRVHFFTFDEIHNIRIESKGIGSSLLGSVVLAIDHKSQALGSRTNRYHMQKGNAERIIGAIQQTRESESAPKELEDFLLRLIKPEGKANLKVLSTVNQVRRLVAKVRGISTNQLWDSDSFATVRNTVAGLIADGRLDGIINEEHEFVSSAMITRKSVEYQIILDFATILSKLETKGIVLQTLECPSCKGQLEYPKGGNSITCTFCGATIAAIDIFEKFKAFLS